MYVNVCKDAPQRIALIEMGQPQPRKPIQTGKLAAHSVVTNNIQPRRTKSMDMRFHWLRFCNTQGPFRYYWIPGKNNLADYWKKATPRVPSQVENIQCFYTNVQTRTVTKFKITDRKEKIVTKLSPTARLCWTEESGSQFKPPKGMWESSQITNIQRAAGMTP